MLVASVHFSQSFHIEAITIEPTTTSCHPFVCRCRRHHHCCRCRCCRVYYTRACSSMLWCTRSFCVRAHKAHKIANSCRYVRCSFVLLNEPKMIIIKLYIVPTSSAIYLRNILFGILCARMFGVDVVVVAV